MKTNPRIHNFWTTSWQEPPLPSKGMYPHAFCVFVFLSLVVSHSHCHTPSLSPNTFVDCCFVCSLRWVVMFVFVTCRRLLSLVISLSMSLSHACTHTQQLALPLTKHPLSLSLVDCCFSFLFFRLRHCCSWHFYSSHPPPSISSPSISSPSISPPPIHTVL